MIRNIVFDIGNVLAEFSWWEHLAPFGFTGEKAERIGKAMMLNPTWNELDRGVWSREKLLQSFIKEAPDLEQEIRLVFSDLSTIVRKFPKSDSWVQSLKDRGYHVYYLSNYSSHVRKDTEKELTFMKLMDGGIMSYEVQLIKPDLVIYQTLMERYDLQPEECVFLDDTKANIDGALRAGMQGILVKTQEQAMQDLDELLKTN